MANIGSISVLEEDKNKIIKSMKIKKANNRRGIIKLFLTMFIVVAIVSCGDKDGEGLYSDTKNVTYAFKLDDATAEYVTALIVYGDRMGLSQTVTYNGSAPWELSFDAPIGLSPFMYVSLVKKDGVTPQTFPVTLSYQGGIVNGESYQSLSQSWTFDDLDDYNEFFVHSPEDDGNGDAIGGE